MDTMNRFPKGARVCFVGDSITYDNTYLAHIVSYYRKHFPEDKVEFYNCGIPGCSLKTIFNTFEENVAPYNPTHMVLLMGMNDSDRTSLSLEKSKRYAILKESYDVFQQNVARFCQKAKEIGAELILCTPTPYDEYNESSVEAYPGGYALLMGYANFVRNFAQQNGYPLCDYHAYLSEKLHTENIIGDDHVHPNKRGHYYIAKCFLAFLGLDLGDEEPFSEEITHWWSVVDDVRSVITAEYLIIRGVVPRNDAHRLELIAAYAADETTTGPAFVKELAIKYPENKAKLKENIQFTIDFMRNL